MSMIRMIRLNAVACNLWRRSALYSSRTATMTTSTYNKNNKWSIISSQVYNTNMNRSFSAEPGFPDRDDVTSRVLEVVKKFEKVQPEKVTEGSHFVTDLGLDSLDTVELVMAFEDEFSIEIPDADAEKILTCQDAVEYLSNNIHVK